MLNEDEWTNFCMFYSVDCEISVTRNRIQHTSNGNHVTTDDVTVDNDSANFLSSSPPICKDCIAKKQQQELDDRLVRISFFKTKGQRVGVLFPVLTRWDLRPCVIELYNGGSNTEQVRYLDGLYLFGLGPNHTKTELFASLGHFICINYLSLCIKWPRLKRPFWIVLILL